MCRIYSFSTATLNLHFPSLVLGHPLFFIFITPDTSALYLSEPKNNSVTKETEQTTILQDTKNTHRTASLHQPGWSSNKTVTVIEQGKKRSCPIIRPGWTHENVAKHSKHNYPIFQPDGSLRSCTYQRIDYFAYTNFSAWLAVRKRTRLSEMHRKESMPWNDIPQKKIRPMKETSLFPNSM